RLQQLGPALELEHLLVLQVGGARLEQGHVDVRVLAQAGGQGGAGGAAADDEVVELGKGVLGGEVLCGHVCCVLSIGGAGEEGPPRRGGRRGGPGARISPCAGTSR